MSDDWFRELQGAYAAGLPAQLDTISRLAGGGASLRDELVRALHRLGGTAGSHGFNSISSVAQGWERALTTGTPLDGEQQLKRLVAEVQLAIAAFPPAPRPDDFHPAG